jgi:uncharacterized PurR-regulated membrane protein YhhQ (DUF165 family)
MKVVSISSSNELCLSSSCAFNMSLTTGQTTDLFKFTLLLKQISNENYGFYKSRKTMFPGTACMFSFWVQFRLLHIIVLGRTE